MKNPVMRNLKLCSIIHSSLRISLRGHSKDAVSTAAFLMLLSDPWHTMDIVSLFPGVNSCRCVKNKQTFKIEVAS